MRDPEVPTAVIMEGTLCWDVVPYDLIDVYSK
jgi:hypothetical protein